MIIEQATTTRFKRIFLLFNQLVFSTETDAPKQVMHIDQGNYDDEIQAYLREDSPPPPANLTNANAEDDTTDATTEDDVDRTPPMPSSIDLDETLPSLRPGRHASTSISLQESNTVKTSSLTISVMTVPSEPQAEVDTVVAPPKKGRPAARKKAANPTSDTADAAPPPTTRGTRKSTRQAAPPPERGPQSTIRASGRGHIRN